MKGSPMAYKSIISVWDNPGASRATIDYAVELARQEGAHLEVLCLGIDQTRPSH